MSQIKDPFDHSGCNHEQPTWPVQITTELTIDLVYTLHVLWLAAAHGDVSSVLKVTDELGRWIELTYLGFEDEVNAEVDRTHNTARELRTLTDPKAFDASLRELLEGEGDK